MPERTGKQEESKRRESNRTAEWRDGRETNNNDDLMCARSKIQDFFVRT